MMANWSEHLENMRAKEVESAVKALDFYDGYQLEWIKAELNDSKSGVKNWEERGVKPVYVNITKKIVDRSALSYEKPPQREVLLSSGDPDETATDIYADILNTSKFSPIMDDADSGARLLKNVMMLAQSVDIVGGGRKIVVNTLHRGNCDVDYDFKNDTIRSIMYQSAGAGLSGGKLFHYWDAEKTVDIEILTGGAKVVGSEDHGYGIVPVAILWDKSKPRAGFWPKPAWEELVLLNEAVNRFYTDMCFASVWQTYPAWFTDAKIPEATVIGPDTIIEITKSAGETVYLESKSADGVAASLDAFAARMEEFSSIVAENWGVRIKVAGEGTATSGFQLVVEEIPSLQTQSYRLKSAAQFERDMYQVVLAISNQVEYGLPQDSELSVTFKDASLPVNKIEDWMVLKEKIALGYISKEEAWAIEDPDITPEEIEARKAKISGESAGALPDFGGLVGDGEQ